MPHSEAIGVATGSRVAAVGRRSVALLFAATTLCFGTVFVGIKAGLSAGIPPVLFVALRYDLAAPVLLALAALTRPYWRPRTRADVAGVLVAGAFLNALNATLLFLGQQYTTTGAAAVIFSVVPVLVPLFALALLPGERLSPFGVLGVLVGFLGVVLVVSPDPGSLAAGTVGQALVAAAAACVAFGTVLLRRVDPGMPALSLTAWSMAFGAVATHVASLLLGESPAFGVTPTTVGIVLYVALPGTAVAFPAFFALLARVGPFRANLVSYGVPVVAAVTGVLVLGERLAPTTTLGFLVVATGFVLVEREALAAELRRLRGTTG